MNPLLNPQTISIGIELAKDLWQLIHDAKHPHHENRVVEQVKNQLNQAIQKQLKLPEPQETKTVGDK
jgi:hypothetical protein